MPARRPIALDEVRRRLKLAKTGRFRKYYVDMYIKSGPWVDTYVEIKGYLRGMGKEKWEWFLTKHPNSQLWTHPRLLELGIIDDKVYVSVTQEARNQK
jgi:hypothetical protein